MEAGDEERLKKNDREKHDQGREIDASVRDGQCSAYTVQHRFGGLVQEPHERIERISIDPTDNDADDQDDRIEMQKEVENLCERVDKIGKDKHKRAGRAS